MVLRTYRTALQSANNAMPELVTSDDLQWLLYLSDLAVLA